MALEVRYVGTHGYGVWNDFNQNRSQHRQERVPQGVPPGAGQPAGQHRGRPRQHLCVHRLRAPPPAADVPRLPHRGRVRRTPAMRPPTRAPTGRTRRSPGFLAAQNPNPFGFALDEYDDGFHRDADVPRATLAAESAGQLLHRQPGHLIGGAFVRGNRDYTFYNGLQTGTPPAPVEGTPVPGQLHLRPCLREHVPGLHQRQCLAPDDRH